MNAVILRLLNRVEPPVFTPIPREPHRPREPRGKPSFPALEALASYWLGRARGRQAAIDYYHGDECARVGRHPTDVSRDALYDHQRVAEYERMAKGL